MSDQSVTLQAILELKAKTDEIRKGQQDLRNFKSSVDGVNESLSAITKGFATGLGIGGALSVFGAMKSAISEVVGEMRALVETGVDLNKSMETAQIGIAGALKQFFPEKYKDFSVALQGSATAVDALKAKATQFGLSFPDLAEQYQATVGAMFKGGIFDLQKQVDLSVLLKRSLSGVGIEGNRAIRDIVDILNGTANRTVAGKVLGLDDASLQSAKQAGTLYEFLEKKLQGFSAAADAAQGSLAVIEDRFAATKANVAAEATKSLTESYKELLNSLIGLVNSDGFRQIVSMLASAAESAVKVATNVSNAIKKELSNTPGGISRGYLADANSIATRSGGVSNSDELGKLRAEAQAKIEEIEKSIVPYAQNGNFPIVVNDRLKIVQQIRDTLDELDKKGSDDIAKNQAKKAADAELETAAKLRQSREEAAAWLEKNATKYDQLAIKAQLVGTKDEDRLYILNEIISGKDKEYEATRAAANSTEEAGVIDFKFAKEMIPLLNERTTLEQKITREKDAQGKKIDAELDKFFKEVDQGAARLAVEKARSDLQDLDAQKEQIKNDRFATRLEKQQAIYDLLQKEPALINDVIARLQALSESTSDDAARNQIDNEVSSLQARRKKIPAEAEKNRPNSKGADVAEGFARIRDNFATIGSSITEVTNGAIGSLSQAFQNLFTTSETLGQRVRGIFLGIGQSAVKAASDMAAQWLVQHTVMAGISALFRAGEVGKDAVMQAEKTGVHTAGESVRTGVSLGQSIIRRGIILGETIFHALHVALRTAVHIAGEIAKTAVTIVQAGIRIGAIIAESLAFIVQGAVAAFTALASIPYVGPFLGFAAMAAVIAAGASLVGGIKKNFADGGSPAGYVSGPGGPRSDRIPANLSNEEYVLNAKTTSAIGKDRLDAMNFGGASPYDLFAGDKPRASGGGSSGSGGAASGSASPSVTLTPRFIVVDSDRDADRVNDTEANEAWFIKMSRKNGLL